jgi:hypothetical protein
MSANKTSPAAATSGPVSGRARASVVAAWTETPGASPVVESMPEGTSKGDHGRGLAGDPINHLPDDTPGGSSPAVADDRVYDEPSIQSVHIVERRQLAGGSPIDPESALPVPRPRL